MTAALFYFLIMAALMLPLTGVHLWCRGIVKQHPQIMPDHIQRDRYRWAELAMAFTCLAMIWYMWMILDFMVTFCATQPLLGMLAHVPWILGTACVLVAKIGHLQRLRAQIPPVS
ncbi:MAG: hypothetical protein AAF231_03340 [Pseudomonadota bacterium]